MQFSVDSKSNQSQWSTDENDGVIFGNPAERAQIRYIVSWHFVYLCMDDLKPALETVSVVFEPTYSTILSYDGFLVQILVAQLSAFT